MAQHYPIQNFDKSLLVRNISSELVNLYYRPAAPPKPLHSAYVLKEHTESYEMLAKLNALEHFQLKHEQGSLDFTFRQYKQTLLYKLKRGNDTALRASRDIASDLQPMRGATLMCVYPIEDESIAIAITTFSKEIETSARRAIAEMVKQDLVAFHNFPVDVAAMLALKLNQQNQLHFICGGVEIELKSADSNNPNSTQKHAYINNQYIVM